MVRVLIFALMVSEVALAQTTWRGLKFGSTESLVRKTYQGTLEKKTASNGEFSLVDSDQKLRSQRVTAEVHFDKNGKLAFIYLYLGTSASKDPFINETEMDAMVHTGVLINQVEGDLTEKYGKPIKEDDQCHTTNRDLLVNPPTEFFSCQAVWKAEGQNISLIWSVNMRRLYRFLLTYKPLSDEI